MSKVYICVDCGRPFDPDAPGASEDRGPLCNKKHLEGFSRMSAIKKFKNNLKKPEHFASKKDAIKYYSKKLETLQQHAKKNLDMLLIEFKTANYPSEESEIAQMLVSQIENLQGF